MHVFSLPTSTNPMVHGKKAAEEDVDFLRRKWAVAEEADPPAE